MTLSSDELADSPQDAVPFVVLRHEQADGVHYDVMIRRGDALATWKCAGPPVQGGSMECVRLGDHRLAYLDYEGSISGDRGYVTRHDAGVCEIVAWGDSRVEIMFRGSRLIGRYELQRRGGDDQSWSFERLGG